jgi:cytochrome c nitrite reductase small subunit
MRISSIALLAVCFLIAGAEVFADRPLSEIGHPATGITFTDVMRVATLLSAATGAALMIYLQFFRTGKAIDTGRKWLYFIALFMLPVFVMLGGTYFSLEEFKKVEACMDCHQMHPFGADMMLNKESTTLAAKHFRNNWINEYQCYSCHTGYGVAGTVQSKVDGLRHLYGRVTGMYPRPIRIRSEFPNANCLNCHIGGEKYEAVQIHRALHERILDDNISCMRCHGNIHPSIQQRYYPVVTYTAGGR